MRSLTAFVALLILISTAVSALGQVRGPDIVVVEDTEPDIIEVDREPDVVVVDREPDVVRVEKEDSPGFEMVFAVAGVLGALVLLRKRS